MKKLDAVWLGRIRYSYGLEIMDKIHEKVVAGRDPIVLLCEHDPVITCGRRFEESNLLYSPSKLKNDGIDICEVGRGGDVTFHGPGQLVGYPVINVGRRVRQHVDAITKSISDLLAVSSLDSRFNDEFPGIWIGDKKIAAVGIEIREMVSLHGFALNIFPEFRGFDYIVPCGLKNVSVVYWSELATAPPTLEEAALGFAKRFAYYTQHSLNLIEREGFINELNG
ncbi:lipoyl(octanoyl) transferase LipB [Myxococcota bacterium]|nr:lipoyl(octanoyl) transferase LipB [Myxococcota bacterium]MBU1379978.1 lipoyl(octanoyl) transferase LipB [Myxococcota bacterium]MBU1497765.1 lipoyl(octanoyl) transferase LipB [Myxococcota bacterium]